jgi:hypothetical protein
MKPDENQNTVTESNPSVVTSGQTPSTDNTQLSPVNTTINTSPTPKSRKKLLIVLVVVLVIVLIGGGAYALYKHNHKAKPVTSSTTKTNIVSSTAPATSNAVTIDYVTIQTGVNESQDYPMDAAKTALGHYVYIDTSGSLNNSSTDLGGKLVYDGQSVYSGSDLDTGSYVISQNGLHYAYMKYDNSTANIYVDNKLVQSVPNQSSSSAVTLYAVSNSGQDYAYGYAVPTSQSSSVFAIFKDGKQIFQNKSTIFTVDFSDDLSHYVAIVQIPTDSNDNVSDDVIKDGTNEGSGNQAFISPDGSQYISLANNSSETNGTVSVDSKSVGTVTEVNGGGNSIAINNNGTYAFTDFADHLVNINGTNHTIPSTIPNDCGQGCINLFALNQDATHYIVGDYKPVGGGGAVWYMDGKSVTLTGDIEGLEFNNNTLYVYKWSN